MITVELDVFSGRPNPKWQLTSRESSELLDRIKTTPVAMKAANDSPAKLGYRGMILNVDGAEAKMFTDARMPTKFRLADDTTTQAQIEARLAVLGSTASDTVVAPNVKATATDSIVGAQSLSSPEPQLAAAAAGSCSYYFTGSYDFTYWNDPAHVGMNNCYNYASNNRTDTYAQPGRGTGKIWKSLTLNSVKDAALRDGYTTTCSANCLMVALVIWRGTDYHWYRHTGGDTTNLAYWTHKLGTAPAGNKDNSGRYIADVQNCDRGPYTIWGGYLYSPTTVRTTIR